MIYPIVVYGTPVLRKVAEEIDKDYPKMTKGYAFEFGEPATRRILKKLNPSFEYEILTACQKDSLEITDNDRVTNRPRPHPKIVNPDPTEYPMSRLWNMFQTSQ